MCRWGCVEGVGVVYPGQLGDSGRDGESSSEMASWGYASMGSGRHGPSSQADHNVGRDLGVNGHLRGKANLSIEPVGSPQPTVQLRWWTWVSAQ